MLDTQNYTNQWDDWELSKWQLLQYNYFLWNESIVSTTWKPFLLQEGSQIIVSDVLWWNHLELIIEWYKHTVVSLIIPAQTTRKIYSPNGNLEPVYEIEIPERVNILRSWFRETK